MLALVIPYYKIDFFEETLKALARQTNKQYRVYIGDDASPNNPNVLLEKYSNRFDFIYHRFDENLGGKSLVRQWNRCLNLCNDEDWVMILGDDDVLESNCIEVFYNNLKEIESLDVSVVRFATQVIDENGIAISEVHQHPKIEKATDFLIRKFKGGTRSSLSEYVFKKKIVDSIKFKDFPLAWSSDVLGVVEFSAGKDIYTANDALVYFRLSGENITSQGDSIEKNKAWFQFYYYLISNYGKQYPKELTATLFDRLEKVQLNNKKTPLRWIKLIWLYLNFDQYSRFLILFMKIKKSIQ
ncbi:glycosyltransferase family 2 protein [Flavobacterium aquicola]|uniref:GT2 family glycosyltransferase n=1 Tax=Flavobacterium aquicola TaxID=1682742 RepID=A0A3E0EKI7_9FLAO|nr:glycosyltransferase [Flavobacterium aquicola]REG98270.1 GT2 family glycosyltransferase [Flavobacterium aquicola]